MNIRLPVLALFTASLIAACDSPNAPSEPVQLSRLAASSVAGVAVTLQVQDSYQLTAKLSGSRSRTTQWSSANSTVASVNRNGLVTALAGGTTVISASNGTSSESWTINVRAPQRVDVQMSGATTMAIGGQAMLTAIASDSLGNFAPRAVAWSIDSGSSVSVTVAGLVTAVRNGVSVIAANVGGSVGRLRVTVGSAVTATSLTVTPATVTVTPNGQAQFNATVTWSDGTTSTPAVTYSVTGGTITGSGLFTAGAQTGTFTVSADCSCGVRGSAAVTVVATVGGLPPIVAPQAPLEYNPPYPTRTGTTIRVNAGGDLQAALNAAQPGDEVVLADGARFTGNFSLPAKGASDKWIVVRSETVPVSPGTRISPTSGSNLATIVTPNSQPAISTESRANRWRLMGLRVVSTVGQSITYTIVGIGAMERSRDDLPRNIVLDRMIVMGQPNDNVQRCVLVNGDSLAVLDSWVTECHGRGYDAQAIIGWNGGGPFRIENNRLEGSGETVIFGGADPYITGLSPSDIVIRRNYLYRPLSWANGRWTVKNHFELKHARRVVFEGNVLENNWADAQNGYIILLQTVSDNNSAWSWVRVEDVRIENNIIRNSTSGMNLGARISAGGPLPTNPAARIMLKNNLFEKVGRDPISGAGGRLLAAYNDLSNTSILYNTFTSDQPAGLALGMEGTPQSGLVVIGNVFAETEYGLFGSVVGLGTKSINTYAPGGIFQDNVLPGQSPYESLYPAGNWFTATGSAVVFQNPSAGDYSLASSNPFYMGVYGRIGVSMTALRTATAGVTN